MPSTLNTAEIDVEALEPMVVAVARTFAGRGVSFDDLIAEGWLAVVQASKAFVDDGRASFRSYARHGVKGAMADAVREARMVHVPARYFGPKGAALLGECADAARDMIKRHVVNEGSLGAVQLADLAVAPIDSFDPSTEEEPMSASATNGTINRIADRLETEADPASSPHRCPKCDRVYKNKYVKRCYYRDCEASGHTPGPKAKATKVKIQTPAAAPLPSPAPSPAPALDLAAELEVMRLLASLSASARKRVASWASSAFGA